MKYLFIVNPVSGNYNGLKTWRELSHICDVEHLDYDFHYSTAPNKATELVLKYADKDTVVYSVGGDGTLNEVVNGIVHTNSFLGIMPSGTGNDFIKSIDDNVNHIDVGKVNDRYFINVASIGIDAEVANEANRLKAKGSNSELTYLRSIINTVPKFKFPNVAYKSKIKRITLLAVCNGQYYGNNIPIAPDAKIDDGYFDFYEVEKLKKWLMPYVFFKLLKGEHEQLDQVSHSRIKRIKIESSLPLICNIDGETIRENSYKFSMEEKKIKFYQEENESIKKMILLRK